MSTPPFGATKCRYCKGTGINSWGGDCELCTDGWTLPKMPGGNRKAESSMDPPGDDSMEDEGGKAPVPDRG